MASRSLVVKVTAGKDDQERCNQGFTIAATAVASGLQVSLWLTGEAAWFALPDRAQDVALAHAAPPPDDAGALVSRHLRPGGPTAADPGSPRLPTVTGPPGPRPSLPARVGSVGHLAV